MPPSIYARPRSSNVGEELEPINNTENASSDADDATEETDGSEGIDSDEISDGQYNEEVDKFAAQVSNISFGALKQAQDALSRKRKADIDIAPPPEAKLQALRDRLRQIKAQKAVSDKESSKSVKKAKHIPTEDVSGGDNDATDSDSDSAPSEEGAPTKARTSKHAPRAQSAKYQVTRKRQVVDVPKRVVRDPRFDALHQGYAHPGNSEKAYSFLRDYQKSEIAELRAEIKRTKNAEDKEVLKRKVESMQNRLKAKEAKEREQEILREHRKEERGKVEQGKNPYYLKKKDIKEKALVEQFKGMKSKDRERLIERRRKKEGQKEKKRMPNARRFATGSNSVSI